jgi:hypothetical protein
MAEECSRETRNPNREGKPPTPQSKAVVPLMDALLIEESVQSQDSLPHEIRITRRDGDQPRWRNVAGPLLALLVLFAGSASFGQAVSFVVPADAEIREGDTSASPLDMGIPTRFQQVYDASAFSAFPQGLSVGQLAFRGDAFNGHGFGTVISNIEIHLSTTSRSVNSLSPVFDQNVGPDDKMVIGRAAFRLQGDGGTSGTTWPFSTVLDFVENQFLYYPTAGNLLLDIKVFSGVRTARFDAFDRPGGTVSSVFGFGTSFPSSGQATSLGLATKFFVLAVPEPSVAAMLVFGLAGLALALKGLNNSRL